MSRKDEILGELDAALRERELADKTTLQAALTQFQQEQYQAPARTLKSPTRRWLALGGGTMLAGAAAVGIFMAQVPEPSADLPSPRPRSSGDPLPVFAPSSPEEGLLVPLPRHPEGTQGTNQAEGRNVPLIAKRVLISPTSKPVFRPLGDDTAYLQADGFDAYTQRVAEFVRSDADSLKLQLPEVKGADSFIEVPLPKLAGADSAADSAALRAYQDEKAISDSRLQKRVTLAKKAVSFGELLDAIAKETGVSISATRSVADDKLTVFCKDKPLRDLMRQVTQHFGFVWERTGSEPEFVYRLKQPLRNQFLEEELRNKDKNEALLALDREMEGLKKYFDMSPEQAREAAEHAEGKEKEKLEMMGGLAWGPTRLYAGLEADDQAALQAGKKLYYGEGGRELPKELAASTLNSMTGHAFIEDGSISMSNSRSYYKDKKPAGKSPAEVGAQPSMMLDMQRNELGEVSLIAHTGFTQGKGGAMSGTPIAVGISPSASSPKNAEVNASKKKLPAFQKPVELSGSHKPREIQRNGKQVREEVWTSGDALEAIHKATGKDVLGDYFTRLVPHQVAKGSLFEVLTRTCDPLRLRWDEKEGWLTFRSTDFFNMRLKEVPGRLLEKWAVQRKKAGNLTPDELREISRLTDDQLNASTMGEGAKVLYGLEEWSWVQAENLRPIWRFYDTLPTPLRTAMQSETGIRYNQLGMDGRQKFLQGAYQHNSDIQEAIQKGTVSDVFLKSLEASAVLRFMAPAPGATKKPGEDPYLFEFRIPDESGTKQMIKKSGPGSTSINTPD